MRAEIDRLRRPSRRATRPNRPAIEQATAASLRQQLDALRTLDTELKAENHRLREALARQLGHQRATTTDNER